MHPNYNPNGNNGYDYYDPRKPPMVNQMYPSVPNNESMYYQQQQQPRQASMPMPMPQYNNDPGYYEPPKYSNPPMYASYGNNGTMNNGYSGYGNSGATTQPPPQQQQQPREDVSFFLESFENYFQQQGLFNHPNSQRNPVPVPNQPNQDYSGFNPSMPSNYNNSMSSGFNNSSNGMPIPNVPNVNYGGNMSQNGYKSVPSANSYYKYPSSPYPQPQQQYLPPPQDNKALLGHYQTQVVPQEPVVHYNNHQKEGFQRHERDYERKKDFREKVKKRHRRRSSSISSRSRSSRSRSHSTYVRRKTSESMKKSAAFKKMLKDKNNWECPHCKNLNFSKRIRCNRCHKSKPPGLNKDFVDTRKFVKNLGGPPGLFREGDWACSKCDNINFAKRQCCNRCGKEKDSNDTVGVIKGFSRKKGEKSVDKTEKNTEKKSAEKTSEKTTEKSIEKPVEKPQEKPISIEKIEKKSQDKTTPPVHENLEALSPSKDVTEN